ncbi:inositol monophosphatase family protein [Streptomyces sp. NPDC006259]|uniref:inositol monophosphatase family protein n=1 Tax=Streptomyces sp. NPDC006259 TaxID=3364740 RepID=UPI0036A8C7ED
MGLPPGRRGGPSRVRDVSRGGSAAAALAQVATGRADALWAPELRPWDCAAGVLLVQQAGGTVGDLAGPTPGTWPASGDVLAASPALFERLRAVLAEACPHWCPPDDTATTADPFARRTSAPQDRHPPPSPQAVRAW